MIGIIDNTPLHYATEKNNKDIVEELLLQKWKTDINAKNNNGDTSMHIAISKGNKELVQLLRNKQAKIDVKNNAGKTPVELTEDQDMIDMLKAVVSPDDNINQSSFVNIPASDLDVKYPIPTEKNRVVKWSGRYTEKYIKIYSYILFIFGDNDQAKYRIDISNPGRGGKASSTRPTGDKKLPYDRLPKDGGLNGNAIGITTTFGKYTPNINEFKALMDKEFKPIEIWVKNGGLVIVPCDSNKKHNLGTGIAKLGGNIPGAIEYIQSKIDGLIRLGQQQIQNRQVESSDTLKQDLHDTLSKERQSFQSLIIGRIKKLFACQSVTSSTTASTEKRQG